MTGFEALEHELQGFPLSRAAAMMSSFAELRRLDENRAPDLSPLRGRLRPASSHSTTPDT